MSRVRAFANDNLRFDVADEGPEDGEVVVLLHGFPQRHTSWRDVAPRLHEAGYRTLAPDLRGYSPGARPKGRRAYSLDKQVGDVKALVDAVGGPVHVVGHDWGGAYAWSFAGAHRELTRTLTAISTPHPRAFQAALKTREQASKSWYMGAFQVPFLPEVVVGRAPERFERFLRGSGMTADDVARFRAEVVAYGALPGALGIYRAMPMMLTSSGSGMGRTVRVPTTYVWSSGDVALGRPAAEASAQYVDAPYEFVVLDGYSHWLPEHAPQQVADAILARVRG